MDEHINAWLTNDPDPRTRDELIELVHSNQLTELERRFSGRLEFGTAGLRGLLGAGPARMNRLVVRQTTAGLGAYLQNTIADALHRGVVVGCDARRMSDVFAQDVAGTLVAMGFRVHFVEGVAPTPVCAFAVKELNAAGGVVITASHNPPDYNGYKVYWQNGAQIIPPHDSGIAKAIDEAAQGPVDCLPWHEVLTSALCSRLGEELFSRYLDTIVSHCLHAPRETRQQVRLAYTPLHGVGAATVEAALQRAGFPYHTVKSQREPDGTFPTVRFPNPEEPGAMDAVLALARETKADLALANDPDADRLAAAVRDGETFRMLTGNEIGVLLGHFALQHSPAGSLVATTIVSSRMLSVVARAFGADYFETLTGFKWIANTALERQQGSEKYFAFGYEEALGYTLGEIVRDKDGISALLAFADMAASLKARGLTVSDQLEALYREYGIFATAQRSIDLDPDAKGPSMGQLLRRQPPTAIGSRQVARRVDLLAEGSSLPKSDVLLYHLNDGSRVIVRPSGTEPKLKCYYETITQVASEEEFRAAWRRSQDSLHALIEGHQADIRQRATGDNTSSG